MFLLYHSFCINVSSVVFSLPLQKTDSHLIFREIKVINQKLSEYVSHTTHHVNILTLYLLFDTRLFSLHVRPTKLHLDS